MRCKWLVLVIAVSLASVISAQDPTPPVPNSSPKNDAPPVTVKALELDPADQCDYVIEMRVLEGMGLNDDGPKRNAANRPHLAKASDADTTPARVAATPVLPQPSPPPRATRAAAPAAKSSEEDLWDNSLRNPGVRVIAAPKVALHSNVPATVQIQTE